MVVSRSLALIHCASFLPLPVWFFCLGFYWFFLVVYPHLLAVTLGLRRLGHVLAFGLACALHTPLQSLLPHFPPQAACVRAFSASVSLAFVFVICGSGPHFAVQVLRRSFRLRCSCARCRLLLTMALGPSALYSLGLNPPQRDLLRPPFAVWLAVVVLSVSLVLAPGFSTGFTSVSLAAAMRLRRS